MNFNPETKDLVQCHTTKTFLPEKDKIKDPMVPPPQIWHLALAKELSSIGDT